MIAEVFRTLFTKPATNLYPYEKLDMPENFRGMLNVYPEKCIGCRLCEKDCPAKAIQINKMPDGSFEAVIDFEKCIFCAQCVDSCPKKLIESTRDVELAQLAPDKLKVTFSAKPQNPSQK